MPRPDIGPNTPLRLKTAAELAYPDGDMTAGALRREAQRGRLVITRVGGRLYTTLAAIKEMRRLSRVTNPPPPLQCVYVVGFGPYVKIGFTANGIHRRLRDLHSGFPERLDVYKTFPGADKALEESLHDRFARVRLQGEWFRREGALARWIDSGCPVPFVDLRGAAAKHAKRRATASGQDRPS